MPLIDIEIGHVQLQEEGCYQLVFQGQHSTEIAASSSAPVFSKRQFHLFVPNMDDKLELKVAILAFTGGLQSVVIAEERFLLLPSEASMTHHWAAACRLQHQPGIVTGSVEFRYKSNPSVHSIVHACVGARLLNLSVGFLGTLVEHPFEVNLHVYDAQQQTLAVHAFSNANYQILLPIAATTEEVLLLFTERNSHGGSGAYGLILSEPCSGIYSLHLGSSSGSSAAQDLVLTLNYLAQGQTEADGVKGAADSAGAGELVGIVHSSVMRGAIVTIGEDHKAKVSLTPRRRSTFGMLTAREDEHLQQQHAAAEGALHVELQPQHSLLPGANKSVTFVEWGSAFGASPVGCEGLAVHALHRVDPSASIAQLLNAEADTGMAVQRARQQSPHRQGVYVLSSSKSDVLDGGPATGTTAKKNRSKRKELHTVHLGILSGSLAHLRGSAAASLSLRMHLLDVSFSSEEVSVRYSGVLSESSRELFAESSLLSLTLEGQLYLPTSSVVALLKGTAAGVPAQAQAQGESCMSCKVYMSLLAWDPSATASMLLSAAAPASGTTAAVTSSAVHEEEEVVMQVVVQQPKPPGSPTPEEVEQILYSRNRDQQTSVGGLAATPPPAAAAPVPGPVPAAVPAPVSVPVPAALVDALARFRDDQFSLASTRLAILQQADRQAHGELIGLSQYLLPVQPAVRGHGDSTTEEVSRHAATVCSTSEEVHTLPSLMPRIMDTLAAQQATVESLLRDLATQADALQTAGREVRALREDKEALLLQIQQQQQEQQRSTTEGVQQMQPSASTSSVVSHTHSHSSSSAHSTSLQHLLDIEIAANTRIRDELASTQAAALTCQKLLSSHRKDMAQLSRYRDTIAAQEAVISRLQASMEGKLRSKFTFTSSGVPPSQQPPQPHIPHPHSHHTAEEARALREELAEREDEVQRLTEEVQSLKRDLQQAQDEALTRPPAEASTTLTPLVPGTPEEVISSRPGSSSGAVPSTLAKARLRIDQLQAESISRGYRVEALERQLEATSRDHARDMGRLRTRVLELEMMMVVMQQEEQQHQEEQQQEDQQDEDLQSITSSTKTSYALPPPFHAPVPAGVPAMPIASVQFIIPLQVLVPNNSDSAHPEDTPSAPFPAGQLLVRFAKHGSICTLQHASAQLSSSSSSMRCSGSISCGLWTAALPEMAVSAAEGSEGMQVTWEGPLGSEQQQDEQEAGAVLRMEDGMTVTLTASIQLLSQHEEEAEDAHENHLLTGSLLATV